MSTGHARYLVEVKEGNRRGVVHWRCEAQMPFKSQAQRRKFAELLVEGKISPQTYEEWNRETGKKKLPERVKRNTKKRTSEGETAFTSVADRG